MVKHSGLKAALADAMSNTSVTTGMDSSLSRLDRALVTHSIHYISP